MKKWLLVLVVFLGLGIISCYIFFPKEITSSHTTNIEGNINGINRILMNQSSWAKWWPGTITYDSVTHRYTFEYNGYQYLITRQYSNAIGIQTSKQGLQLDSDIFLIQKTQDTTQVEWKFSLETNSNPVNRIYLFWKTKEINKNLMNIMNRMKSFLGKQENIYGINLHVIMSNDSTLVATKTKTISYPSTKEIYSLITSLRKYVVTQGAVETNFPMLNVTKVNATLFETMVAIPVNKHLPGNGRIFFSQFIPWKVLTAEVKGGPYTVNEALTQMGNYMTDYQKPAMAIPFQSLVTDRSKQTDTSQWMTRIYTPVP